MRFQYLILIIAMAIIAVPSFNSAVIPVNPQKSWWNYDTGNETVNGYEMFNTSDGISVNSSFSVTKQKNNTMKWNYSPEGQLIGVQILYPDANATAVWRFPLINFTDINGSVGVRKFTESTGWQRGEAWGYRITEYPSEVAIGDATNVTIESNQTISAYPFVIVTDIAFRRGIDVRYYPDYNRTIISYGNRTYVDTYIYNNGTVIVNRWNQTSIYLNVSGNYSPDALRVVDISFRVVNPQISLSDSNGLISKRLLEFYLYTEIESTSMDPFTSENTSNVESPFYFPAVIAVPIYLHRKRAKFQDF